MPVALKPSKLVLVAFTLVIFDIIRARDAKRRVDKVSSKLSSCGEHATSNIVFVFPPKLCCSNRVNLLSRYGICFSLDGAAVLRRFFFELPLVFASSSVVYTSLSLPKPPNIPLNIANCIN